MSRKKKSVAKGCLFWACLVIILGIAALAARGPIEETLGKLFSGRNEAGLEVVVTPLSPGGESVAPSSSPAASSSNGGSSVPTQQTAGPAVTPPQSSEEKPAVRKVQLFFNTVDPNGKIILKGVIRPIPASDSPLRDTLQSLLAGPTSAEVTQGLLTMIPKGSELRSVVVRGDVAYIDFSESFRFNTLGTEGLNAQLKQVVNAATEFPTVKKEQILIGGKKVQYLASEGIRIDSPLGRQSFGD
jgi:germination protein M